eukprot:COSAG03_NODE_2335_length_2876_cov_1.830393_1_plen_211_part_00
MALLRDFVASATAACCANCVTHPSENIKVRQMLHRSASTASRPPTSLSVARRIVAEDGVSALYKGLSPALVRAVISGGGRLAGYNGLKGACERAGWLSPNGDGPAAKARQQAVKATLAVAASCTAQLAAAPADLLRTRQAAHRGTLASCPSMGKIAAEVVATDGVAGLFAGSSALMGRAASFNISQLLTCEHGSYSSSSQSSVLIFIRLR